MTSSDSAYPIYTVGHSHHPLEVLLDLLARHAVSVLVDVRAAPWSRRHPQYNREALEAALEGRGLHYRWLGRQLGGLRTSPAGDEHRALSEPGFRAYAAHLASDECRDMLARLQAGARRHRLALMCAEADYTHCHRRFIADALTVTGSEVLHIGSAAQLAPHLLHPALRLVAGELRYDRATQDGLFDTEAAG